MSESEFAAMLVDWAKKFCTTYNDGEYLPYENQADEDEDLAEHGSDHVVFAYAGRLSKVWSIKVPIKSSKISARSSSIGRIGHAIPLLVTPLVFGPQSKASLFFASW